MWQNSNRKKTQNVPIISDCDKLQIVEKLKKKMIFKHGQNFLSYTTIVKKNQTVTIQTVKVQMLTKLIFIDETQIVKNTSCD